MNDSFGLAAFRSRTQVLRMEDALHRAGLSAGVIATPREVAIGCGESVAMTFLSTHIRAFRALHPQVQFRIYSANADDVKERIEKGLLDMGLLLEQPDSEAQRLRMMEEKRNEMLDEIHFHERQLQRLDYLRHEIQKDKRSDP